MVHADLVVPGFCEAIDRKRQQPELRIAAGEQGGVDPLLVGTHPGHESERVDRQAVGPQPEHEVERPSERSFVLARQPVDEIDVDRLVAQAAGMLVEARGLFPGLVPADQILHPLVGVLNSHRDPVEAQFAQCCQVFFGGDSWIDLEGDLRVGGQFELGQQPAVQVGQGCGRVEGRGASTPVVLLEHTSFAQPERGRSRLGHDAVEVGVSHTLLAGDDHVACTERAPLLAERQMHIQRERGRSAEWMRPPIVRRNRWARSRRRSRSPWDTTCSAGRAGRTRPTAPL